MASSGNPSSPESSIKALGLVPHSSSFLLTSPGWVGFVLVKYSMEDFPSLSKNPFVLLLLSSPATNGKEDFSIDVKSLVSAIKGGAELVFGNGEIKVRRENRIPLQLAVPAPPPEARFLMANEPGVELGQITVHDREALYRALLDVVFFYGDETRVRCCEKRVNVKNLSISLLADFGTEELVLTCPDIDDPLTRMLSVKRGQIEITEGQRTDQVLVHHLIRLKYFAFLIQATRMSNKITLHLNSTQRGGSVIVFNLGGNDQFLFVC